MCIDIMEIWFEICNGQVLLIFDSYLPTNDNGGLVGYYCFTVLFVVDFLSPTLKKKVRGACSFCFVH